MINVELGNRVLEAIRSHPEHWDQDSWVEKKDCGTTMCFAGWTVHLAGEPFVWGWAPTAYQCKDDRGRVRDIPDRARELLGITIDQSYDLFFTNNDLEELERVWNEIVSEHDHSG